MPPNRGLCTTLYSVVEIDENNDSEARQDEEVTCLYYGFVNV